jgi:exopolyphosphatase
VKQHGVTDVCLLDHNVPQGSIAKLISENPDLKVSGIIDHHEDERKYLDASPRVISRSGSCSSLVWDFWKEKVDSSKGDTTANGIQDAVTLLSAALVLDTSNCTSKMEKFDWDASESYKKISADDAVTASSFDAWFQQLQDARNDIGDLNIKEILTKDYKFFDFQVGTSESSLRLGISSMIKSFEWLLEQQEKPALDVFRKEALTFISSNDIDALLIMCAFTNPLTNSFERQLVFITNTVETSILLRLVIDSITEELKLETIQLEEIQDDQLPMVKFFNQRNVKGSRKLVAPVIKAALNAL